MVFVSSYGMVSALGMNVSENLESIFIQKDVLVPPTILKTKHSQYRMAEIPFSDEALRQGWKISDPSLNRTALLGVIALGEALSEIPKELLARAAFINGTTVGGMDSVEKYYARMIMPDSDLDEESYLHALDASFCTRKIAAYYGIKGFQTTLSTACSSAANAIQLGAKMIEQGLVDVAICGGTDALTRFTLNGFISLKNVDALPCRPFDDSRSGLNLGEGAGYLVLESEKSVCARKASPRAIVAGYCNTNEAHHPTAPSPDGSGAFRTMKGALDAAGIGAEAIDFIVAHGTATVGNDLSEGLAIQRLFGKEHHPAFASLKSYTGHTLAASGGIESIVSCLMLEHQFLLPSLRFKTAITEAGISPQQQLIRNHPNYFVLNNSFGFGGNDVSLVFRSLL